MRALKQERARSRRRWSKPFEPSASLLRPPEPAYKPHRFSIRKALLDVQEAIARLKLWTRVRGAALRRGDQWRPHELPLDLPSKSLGLTRPHGSQNLDKCLEVHQDGRVLHVQSNVSASPARSFVLSPRASCLTRHASGHHSTRVKWFSRSFLSVAHAYVSL